MARFDVYQNPEGAGYLLDVQAGGGDVITATQFLAAVPVASLDSRRFEIIDALDMIVQGF